MREFVNINLEALLGTKEIGKENQQEIYQARTKLAKSINEKISRTLRSIELNDTNSTIWQR